MTRRHLATSKHIYFAHTLRMLAERVGCCHRLVFCTVYTVGLGLDSGAVERARSREESETFDARWICGRINSDFAWCRLP